jgi:hypothetical protein
MKFIVSTTLSCVGPCHVSSVMPQCSREVSISRFNHHKYHVSIPMSVHVLLIHQLTALCQFRVVDGGYIKALLQQVCFLSTSTHYPGTRIRNQLVPWDLHASMAGLLAFDRSFTSVTSDRMIPRMFDLNSFIHICWNVLGYLGNH